MPDVPVALDQLVMELLQMEAGARPPNAAEVLERLSAISGVRGSEQAVVALAYLSDPSLVGREEQIGVIRKATLRALQQRQGGSLFITGPPGLGRSRMLDACVLEAKLAGLVVVRIDGLGTDDSSDFAVARPIAAGLLQSARAHALSAAGQHVAVLRHAMPELFEPSAGHQNPQSEQIGEILHDGTAALLSAMESWLLAFARKRPLLVALDDFSLLDQLSARLLAVLAEDAASSGVLLAVTMAAGDVPPSLHAAFRLIESRSEKLTLEPLTRDQTHELLASVFGDVPQLAALTQYLYGLADGNPRDTMHVAQQLVAEELIQYSGGAWSLPDRVRLNFMPASLRNALEQRARRLSASAQELALAFALEPKLRFSFDECVGFSAEVDPRSVFQNLEDLVFHDVLQLAGTRYGLRQQAWIEPLVGSASSAQQRRVHGRLAEILQKRGDDVRATHHLFASGELARGLDLLLSHVDVTTRDTERDPNAWFDVFVSKLDTCQSTHLRAQCGLTMMMEQSRAQGGLLYVCMDGVIERVALSGIAEPMKRSTRGRRPTWTISSIVTNPRRSNKWVQPRLRLRLRQRSMGLRSSQYC